MKYTKLNDPNTYSRITPELEEMPIPAHTIFNVAENEEIKRSYVQSRTTTLQELRILLDEEEVEDSDELFERLDDEGDEAIFNYSDLD